MARGYEVVFDNRYLRDPNRKRSEKKRPVRTKLREED
jgi:hypothetical protein